MRKIVVGSVVVSGLLSAAIPFAAPASHVSGSVVVDGGQPVPSPSTRHAELMQVAMYEIPFPAAQS